MINPGLYLKDDTLTPSTDSRMITNAMKAFLPLFLLSLFATPLHAVDAPKAASQPNVLFIISDDQGYSDFGFTGNPQVKTPVLDRLATESAVFQNFVVAPACSPSRAAFFTGREHLVTGVWGVPLRDNLRTDEALMPAYFRAAGYRTFYAGKRDIGRPPYTTPWERGWDNGYFVSGYQHRDPRLPNRGKTISPKGWTCDIMTDLILDFWKQNPDDPWLVAAAYIIPHLPFVVDEKYSQPFRDAGLSEELALCYGSIAQMDTAIGRLLDGLCESGQMENTIVFFVSDNGMSGKRISRGKGDPSWPQADWAIRNLHQLRGSKAEAWENGIRVPCLVRWPGRIAPGKRPQLGGAEDILPTMLDLAGIVPSVIEHLPLTGVSLRPALEDAQAKMQRPNLFRIAISGKGAPRELPASKQRRFKDHHLVLRGPRFKYHALPGGENALYDIDADPCETADVQLEFPEVTARMAKDLRDRWDAVITSGRAFLPRKK
jgi:arylsulfatase A-like enzyme